MSAIREIGPEPKATPKATPRPQIQPSGSETAGSETAGSETVIAAAMARSGFTSFRALAKAAAVSEAQLRQLRRGDVAQLRLAAVQRLASVLALDWRQLIGIDPKAQQSTAQVDQLRAEYGRLEQRMAAESDRVRLEVQRSALVILEPWLKNWPKVVHAVGSSRPELPLAQVLGLLAPIDQLLASWNLERMGTIGESIVFDPRWHIAIEGNPAPGDPVLVRRPGYRQGDVLLARAEVSP